MGGALSTPIQHIQYQTREAIVSAIHPLRLTLKFLGYDRDTIKELFLYPSSVKAKLSHKAPPPYVLGHLLDKAVFAITDDMYRALFCLINEDNGSANRRNSTSKKKQYHK